MQMDEGSKRFDQSQGWFTDLTYQMSLSSCLTRSEGFNADPDKCCARACVYSGGSAPRPACSQGTLLFIFAVCIWGTKCLQCWQIDVQIAVMSGTWALRCQTNCVTTYNEAQTCFPSTEIQFEKKWVAIVTIYPQYIVVMLISARYN